MDNYVKECMKMMYSQDEIYEALGDSTNIVLYSDLIKYNKLEDVFNGSDSVIILYQQSKNIGHFNALIKHNKNKVIENFDSYGLSPLDVFDMSQYNTNVSPKVPALLILMKDFIKRNKGWKIELNKANIQTSKNSNICGRACVLRILLKDVPLKKFTNLFIGQKLPSDYYITMLTLYIA